MSSPDQTVLEDFLNDDTSSAKLPSSEPKVVLETAKKTDKVSDYSE